MRRLDLGCGRQKNSGFLGVDRFPLPGVDVVADLDRSIPFADNTFDLVVAFHALEHLKDLQRTLHEVWRVCRPGAEVCLAGPYWAQGINVANPYHRQAFNEHSPRFWTDAPAAPIAGREFVRPPQGAMWGLASSDNSSPGFDFRTVRVEFFYFAEFWGLRPEELTELRRRGFDVCEQILFTLVACKPLGAAFELPGPGFVPFDPPLLAERRRMAAAAPPRRFSWRRLLRRLISLGRI